MNGIINLNSLEEELLKIYDTNKNDIKYLSPVLSRYCGNDWKKYIKIDKDKYNRHKVPLKNNKYFDIYILTWYKYQNSEIHDHSENGCLLKILDGTLYEHVYSKNLSYKEKNEMNKNDISYMDNSIGYHKIINSSENITYSLHIYSPPNYKTKYIVLP